MTKKLFSEKEWAEVEYQPRQWMRDDLVKQLPDGLAPSIHFGRHTTPDKGYYPFYTRAPSAARDILITLSSTDKPLFILD
eukprot:11167644-Karenia_brevis.AAC.1